MITDDIDRVDKLDQDSHHLKKVNHLSTEDYRDPGRKENNIISTSEDQCLFSYSISCDIQLIAVLVNLGVIA
jgi:hypothetical protein